MFEISANRQTFPLLRNETNLSQRKISKTFDKLLKLAGALAHGNPFGNAFFKISCTQFSQNINLLNLKQIKKFLSDNQNELKQSHTQEHGCKLQQLTTRKYYGAPEGTCRNKNFGGEEKCFFERGEISLKKIFFSLKKKIFSSLKTNFFFTAKNFFLYVPSRALKKNFLHAKKFFLRVLPGALKEIFFSLQQIFSSPPKKNFYMSLRELRNNFIL
jgi:hypothetical protein